ncbi:MAG: phenylacetic acid degradation protein [Rhodospirillales bacterium 69-11]|nr:2Fe-2S iron-sulfur cluster binding domain-containing protein [Rhodospirillales bacterium]OJW26100.1 MAG: phenylacetic acid degradation protein [Rhodospirillales bacterium 69-11]
MSPRFHDLTVAAIEAETADARVLHLAVPAALRAAYRFQPGQYLTLEAVIEGAPVRRSYSICSTPADPWLAVAVKRIPGGAFSGFVHETLRAGDTLSVMTPDGRFVLPPAEGPRLVAAFVAGSGITPVLSILRTLLEEEPESRFVLFYGNRSTDGIMFRGVLEDLKDRHLARLSVFHVLSREQQDVPILNGRLDAEKLRRLLGAMLPAGAIDQALVCGPQPMIEGLPAVLAEAGVSPARIHVERFTPAADARPRAVAAPATAPAESTATVIYEGVRTEIPLAAGETIIDAALRAGRALPWSCKGGMCCTCRAKLLEGRVEMLANYSLEPWETEAGFVLTCQSRPLTPHVVVDYDQV